MMTDNWNKLLCFCLVFFFYTALQAQDKFGAVHSNYSPTNSVRLNPSSMLDAKTWLDIHIVGGGSYLNNNFLAIENESWIGALSRGAIDESQLLYNSSRNRYHVYNRNDVSALSAVLSQGDHAFGLSFNAFTYVDVRRAQNTVVRPLAQFLQNEPVTGFNNLNVEGLRFNAVNYGEAKISYAYTSKKIFREMWMVGASLKKIFPVVGSAGKVSDADYSILPNELLAIREFNGDAMFNVEPEFTLLGGMGLDLGITYQKMIERSSTYAPNSPKNGCRRKYYRYKIGVSILDLGSVKFRESTTETYAIEVDSILVDPSADIEDVLNANTTGTETGSITRPNRMGLPTVLSVQLDFNVWDSKFFINGTIIQGVSPFPRSFGVRRANSLSVTPRFETKFFDIAMPLSVYEYQQLQMGLSMRLLFLTIGTDKLLSMFVPSDLYGADLYVQLKVPLFKNPKCKDKGFNSKKARRKRKNLCNSYW